MQGITQHLAVSVFETGEEAASTHTYHSPEYTGLNIVEAVVVRRGTERGNSTVDFVMVDENGKKYVGLITAALLKSIVELCETDN